MSSLRRSGGGSRPRGAALVYVLLVALLLVAFTAAVAARHLQTLRFVTYDEHAVRARLLAESGAHLAVVLMRDSDPFWYEGREQPIPSPSLGPGFTPEVLGGTFEIEVVQEPSLYPDRGSFLTVISTGRSGNRRARTAVTVKLTNPLINFMMVSQGKLELRGWGSPLYSGPLFANQGPGGGDVWLWHDVKWYDTVERKVVHSSTHPRIDAEIKAAGRIYLRSRNVEGEWSADPIEFNGKTDPGSITHQDLPGTTNRGSLTIVNRLEASPEVELNVKVPSVDEVLKGYRDRPGVLEVDVSDYPQGVLAEFVDGKLVLSQAEYKTVGRLYDKDLYETYRRRLVGEFQRHYEVPERTADSLLRNEVAWDDPDFPDAEYPPDLQTDLDGDGRVETSGDYLEVRRVVRGPILQSFTLDRDRWTRLRLVTRKTDYLVNGVKQAPPLFLRGNVKGKAVLVYDVADDSLDPHHDRIHTFVLAQHEAPGESKYPLAIDGPGVPGGLRYEDPRVKVLPDQEVSSPDGLLVVSRGSFNAVGDSGFWHRKVRKPTGETVDYAAFLDDLDQAYSDYYRSRSPEWKSEDFDLARPSIGDDRVWSPLHGIYLAHLSRFYDNRLSAEGYVVPRHDRAHPSMWDNFLWRRNFPDPGSWPEGAQADRMALFSLRLRNARTNNGCHYHLKGSLSSLGSPLGTQGGTSYYDYKFQELTAEEVGEAGLGLPVSVVVCSWQRL